MKPEEVQNINEYTRLSVEDIMYYFGVKRSAAYKRKNEILEYHDRNSNLLVFKDLADYDNIELEEVVNRILHFNEARLKAKIK